MPNPLSITAMKRQATRAAGMLKLLANAKRLMILCHIGHKEMTVNELVKAIGLSQSAVSQHLAKMRADKLVVGEKRGQSVFYRIANPEVEAMLSTLYLIYCRD